MSTMPTPLRVLVVEDEALLSLDMQMTIEDCGHVVAGEAQCLESALALADDTNPHLAFVDVHLARNTSGLDVSTMIQRRWPNAVIVFVTANPRHVPDGLGGAHGIIAKPFSHAGLIATLKFLSKKIFDYPPDMAQPMCLVTIQHSAARWAH